MLYKFKCAVARFMYGRNGMDQLNMALFTAYIALWLVQMIMASVLKSQIFAAIMEIVVTALCVIVLFRMFSKNLPKRRAENQKWMSWWWGIKNRNAGAKARRADKEHKYFTCKTCGTVCRVPVGKGKIIITCPKCRSQIQAKT